MCLLLRRLSYPCRYHDLIPRFGRPVPELCMLTNTVLDGMYDNHGHRLTSWNQPFLSPAYLERYAHTITMKGSPLTNCFGFIDATVRQISNPGENQRILYSGHKRVHSLKFQSVALPNGLIANLYGPVEGRRHDASMLKDSGLLTTLQREAYNSRGDPLCLYEADAPVFTPEMRAFNTAMIEVRVSVEWIFGDIVEYFKFVDYKKTLSLV